MTISKVVISYYPRLAFLPLRDRRNDGIMDSEMILLWGKHVSDG